MSGGILRKMVWKLSFNVDATKAVSAKAVVSSLSGAFEKLTTSALYAAGAMGAVYGAAALLAVQTAKYSEEVARISSGLDISTTKYQEYRAAFSALGGSTDDLTDAFGTLVDRAKDAIEGSKQYVKEFKRMGISIDELKGKNAGELFDLYIEKATKVKDRTEAIASAVRLFGDDLGRRLLPVMVENSESMKVLMRMASDLGLVLDKETIKKNQKAAITFRSLEFLITGMAHRLGTELIPAFELLAGEVLAGLQTYAEPTKRFFTWVGREGVNEAKKVVVAMKNFFAVFDADALYTAGDLLARVARFMRLIVVGVLAVASFGVAIGFFKGLGAAGLALAGALGLVAGVFEDLWVWWNGGISLIDVLKSKFPELGYEAALVRDEVLALLSEMKALGSELYALIGQMGEAGPNGANAFESGLKSLFMLIFEIISVATSLTRTLIALARILVWLSSVLYTVTSAGSSLTAWFDDTISQAGELVGLIYDLTGMLRGLAELNPLLMAPLAVLRKVQGGEVGLGASIGRIGAPLTRVNSWADSANARLPGGDRERSPRGGMPATAGMAMRSSAIPRLNTGGTGMEQTNNVTVNLPATTGNPELDGRAAAKGFTDQIRDAESMFPGIYLAGE